MKNDINLERLLKLSVLAENDNEELKKLQELLKYYINMEENEEINSKNIFKLLSKLIKDVEKYNNQLTGVWEANDKQYFCNGYMLIEINNPIKGLPVIESNLHTTLEGIKKECTLLSNIDIQALKTHTKVIKAMKYTQQKDCCYKIHKAFYDPHLLLDCLNIIGTKNLKVFSNEKPQQAVYFETDIGSAFILPVRVNDKTFE